MAISEFRTDRIGRVIAAAQLVSEAKANDPQGVGASEAAKAAMWTGWSELLRIGARAKHSDIPAAGTRIYRQERIRATIQVVDEIGPEARESLSIGFAIYEIAWNGFFEIRGFV